MYLAELPWHRGCSVIRGASRELLSFFSVSSTKLHLASHPLASSYSRVTVSSVFCAQNTFCGPSVWGPVKAVVKYVGGLLASRHVFCWLPFAFFCSWSITSDESTPLYTQIKKNSRGLLAQSTESRELHTHRTIADGERNPRSVPATTPKCPDNRRELRVHATVYMYACVGITYIRVKINRVRLPILFMVS